MRVLLDPNLLISHLLVPLGGRNPTRIVEAATAGVFVLLLPQDAVDELRRRVASKPYLRDRITTEELEALIRALATSAIALPELSEGAPVVGRDPKDDYLIAHAVLGRADYLVSGDADLVSLGEVAGVRLVNPARFIQVLREAGLLP